VFCCGSGVEFSVGHGMYLIVVRRLFIFSLPLIGLAVTVPWGFSRDGGQGPFGLPGWAVYSLAAGLGYAVLVAILFGRCWELSAGGDDEGDGDDS